MRTKKSTSRNTDVIKKNKNNRTHGENAMEIVNNTNNGSTEYLCSEKSSSKSKKTRLSETSDNHQLGKKI